MKDYKRLTTKCEVGIGLTETSGNIVNDYEKVVNRLAELEDKIERGELVEVPKGAVVLTPEERDEEIRLANEERKQAVKEFSDKILSVSKITFSALTEPRIELSLAKYKQLVRKACEK